MYWYCNWLGTLLWVAADILITCHTLLCVCKEAWVMSSGGSRKKLLSGLSRTLLEMTQVLVATYNQARSVIKMSTLEKSIKLIAISTQISCSEWNYSRKFTFGKGVHKQMQLELHQLSNKKGSRLRHTLLDKNEDHQFLGPTNFQVTIATHILLMFLGPSLPLRYLVMQKHDTFFQDTRWIFCCKFWIYFKSFIIY